MGIDDLPQRSAAAARPGRWSTLTVATVLAAGALTAGTSTASAVSSASAAPAAPAAPARVSPRQRSVNVAVAAGAVGYLARVDDGQRVTTAVAGLANRKTGRALRVGDEFEIGSNTKLFMATLTLQSVARGELKLTDTVEKHLPGVVPNGGRITVRMLLNHTSGLFNYTEDATFGRRLLADPEADWTPKQLVAIATEHPPTFAPGRSWSYSNTNYILVGMILRKVTGQTPADLVERRIAHPLGLTHTYLVKSTAESTGRGYAHGYRVTFGGAGTTPRYRDVSTWNLGSWANTAGAMVSTADELDRFLSALLGGRLLRPAQLAQMRTTVPLPKSFGLSGGYGLGIIRLQTPCGTVWGHGGDTLGHHSTALASADGRRSAVADSTVQIDRREKPGPAAVRAATAVGAADATAICAMYGKAVPRSSAKAAA